MTAMIALGTSPAPGRGHFDTGEHHLDKIDRGHLYNDTCKKYKLYALQF